jgi:hypothetical protein
MASKQGSGSGKHRKKGDWIAVAKGRSNKSRWMRDTLVCPINHHHIVTVAGFPSHLMSHGGSR